MLGYERVGSGGIHVIVLNDWMCDTSTWDAARAYLDREAFSWAFTDLRGYGRSRGQSGRFDVEESAADVLGAADELGWRSFAIVGHSMSTLVALHLAQHAVERIERAVLLTPPPPTGFGADDATIDALRAMARGDDATRLAALAPRWRPRLSSGWVSFKAARWRAAADAEAAAGYVTMFARHGLPSPTARVGAPVLAVTGEHDAPPMRGDAVRKSLSLLCDRLEVRPITDSGHYPMQETPPLLVSIVEAFLSGSVR